MEKASTARKEHTSQIVHFAGTALVDVMQVVSVMV